MHSFVYRMNTLVTFAVLLLGVLCAGGSFLDSFNSPSVRAHVEVLKVNRFRRQLNGNDEEVKFQPILKIVDKRWQDQMHRPLHLAGFFLNPSLYFKAREKDEASCGKFETGFFSCLERMVPDLDHQDKIGDQVTMYLNERGIFGRELAIRARGRRMPIEWWVTYGGETPELKSIAIRILGLCCSASGCERNWSTFEFVALTFNISVDLQSAFTWNTKQVFVFVAAEYETPKNALNQISLWDHIIPDKEHAKFGTQVTNKYLLIDQGSNLRGKKIELVLRWHVMPKTGRMIQDKIGVSSFQIPEAYT